MSEHNRRAVARLLTEPANGNLNIVDEVLAEDFMAHMAITELEGREAYRQYLASVRTAFPDMNVVIDEMVAGEDRVAVRFTFSGTNTGILMGLPPTGKKVINTEALFVTFADGLAVEAWQFTDSLPFYRQLGIDPPRI